MRVGGRGRSEAWLHGVGGTPSSPVIEARRLLLVMPVTANEVDAQGAGQGLEPRVAERRAEAFRRLACRLGCAIARRLDSQGRSPGRRVQFGAGAVDRTSVGLELVEMCNRRSRPQIVGVVDDGLDAQRAPVLEVLLDAGVLVESVDVDLGAVGDDLVLNSSDGLRDRWPRLKMSLDASPGVRCRGCRRPAPRRTPSIARCVEQERARHLDLTHRQLPPVPGVLVGAVSGSGSRDSQRRRTPRWCRAAADRRSPAARRDQHRRRTRWTAR